MQQGRPSAGHPQTVCLTLDTCYATRYKLLVIRTFRHKGLRKLFNDDDASGLRADLVDRIREALAVIDDALSLSDINIPGLDFHQLKNTRPRRYTIHVNGPWCITFEFEDGDALRVDLENYH